MKSKLTYIPRIFSSCVMLIAFISAAAQSFTSQIEDVGDFYRLSFTVTSLDAKNFTPPSLANFDVLSGPNQSTARSIEIVNGRSSRRESITYTYILSPRRSGRMTIGAASIQVNGRTLHTRPLSVDAVAGKAQTGRGVSGQRGSASGGEVDNGVQQIGSPVTQKDLFIDVTPSRTKVYEQEAILLTYKVHARVGVGLANTTLAQKPDFKGMISQDIPLPGNQIQTTLEHRDGHTYRTGTLLQYVIFPQQSGALHIPSLTFDCTVVQQDNTLDFADAFFNGGGSIGVSVTRKTPELTLEVASLPTPKPAGFSGAVGKFAITGNVLNKTIKTNDVATYRITLNGLGNLKLITPPTVDFPKDFDTYDAKTNDNTKVSAEGLKGELTFDYTFVPRNVGQYTIPSVELIYFDTESNAYRTISTQPITLNVEKGERSNADVDKQLALLHSDIKDIHPYGGVKEKLSDRIGFNTLAWYLWLVAALMVGAMTYAVTRKYRNWQGNSALSRRNRAGSRALKRIREIRKQEPGAKAANTYMEVQRLLTDYIMDTFGIGQSELSRERISQLLTERNVSEETLAKLNRLLDDCEYAQYAPVSDSNAMQLCDEAEKILGELISQIRQ